MFIPIIINNIISFYVPKQLISIQDNGDDDIKFIPGKICFMDGKNLRTEEILLNDNNEPCQVYCIEM